jgi:hypothetical protein
LGLPHQATDSIEAAVPASLRAINVALWSAMILSAWARLTIASRTANFSSSIDVAA